MLLARLRQLAFAVILVCAFNSTPVATYEAICPGQQCHMCPSPYYGSCYSVNASCWEFDCDAVGECQFEGGGSATLCMCAPCAGG